MDGQTVESRCFMNVLDELYSLWIGKRLPDASVESSKKDLVQMLESTLGKDQEEMFSDFLLEYVGQVERRSFSAGFKIGIQLCQEAMQTKEL